ncbi:MAG: hypothetical protein JNL01_13255 [Bdellovibrionales bacterium]|nr:hypothetical protein [Bdellovibrionales bacterium]
MGCQPAKHCKLWIFQICAVLCLVSDAFAHSSRTDFDFQAGNGGMVEFGFLSRIGFTPYSPWYWNWELKRTSSGNYVIGNGAMKIGSEIGREDRRISWGIRGQGMGHSFGPAQEFSTGGSFRVRFIPSDVLSFGEKRDLDREEREVRAWQRDIVAQSAVPTAPIFSFDFDSREVRSNYSGGTAFGNSIGQIAMLYQVMPFWIIVPSWQFFTFSGDYSTNAQTLMQIPTNRLIRWGPQGLLSGIAGNPTRSIQLMNYFNYSDRLGLQLGFQWVTLDLPRTEVGSLWLGAERKFGNDQSWSALAGLEWTGIGAPADGLITVRLRYQGQDRFIPRR